MKFVGKARKFVGKGTRHKISKMALPTNFRAQTPEFVGKARKFVGKARKFVGKAILLFLGRNKAQNLKNGLAHEFSGLAHEGFRL